jgi:hypothetical protein
MDLSMTRPAWAELEDKMALAKRRLTRLGELLDEASTRAVPVRGDIERARERIRFAENHLSHLRSKRQRLAARAPELAHRRH